MTATLALIVFAVLFLAYSNGANDNFKGVATLYGSGTCTYRTALAWATVTTLAGSLLALMVSHGLVATFKGKGLLPDAIITQPEFMLAVGLGGALTVILATMVGLPVSTTHALTGGLVGAGLMAAPTEVRFSSLLASFVVPLLFSPVAALLLTISIYPCFRWARRRMGVTSSSCLCIGTSFEEVVPRADGALMLAATGLVVEGGKVSDCVERYQGCMLGLNAGTALDRLHYLSGGAVGFARGLNDTPKLVALLLATEAIRPNIGLTLVAVAMAVGGILNSRRVAETMSRRITRMNTGQGFTANLVTALFVAGASRLALPVSTTHVACGSLFGIGVVNRTAQWKLIATILFAWMTTLPIGAIFAAAVYLFCRAVHG